MRERFSCLAKLPVQSAEASFNECYCTKASSVTHTQLVKFCQHTDVENHGNMAPFTWFVRPLSLCAQFYVVLTAEWVTTHQGF